MYVQHNSGFVILLHFAVDYHLSLFHANLLTKLVQQFVVCEV